MIDFKKIRKSMDLFWDVAVQVQRNKATEIIEFELKELENIFVILLMGSFIGLPSPPAAMAMELIPYLEDEIRLMTARSDFAQDPIGGLAGILDIG